MRFAVLTEDQVNNLLYGDGDFTIFMTASDHSVKHEKYDRFAYFDLPNGGYNMYNTAINTYKKPGTYQLVGNQCDDVAVEILNQGGFNILALKVPNWTYDSLNVHKWEINSNR